MTALQGVSVNAGRRAARNAAFLESLIVGHESRMLTAHPRAGFIADRKDRSERNNNLASRERRRLNSQHHDCLKIVERINSREIDSFHSSSLALFLTAGCLAETRIC